ncbi:MAG: efflux RND transporter permease subunit, partial [Cyanobacteria bacterium J06598_3]
QVFRSNGSLLASVEDGVKEAIALLEKETLAEDIQLQLIFTRATDIRDAYQASIEALILGSILAVVVVGCFLRNWRTTLITAVALPLSIVPTFIIIKALGYSLNSMTLLALTLAVGNLVDDAIVEIENIERHINLGKSPTQAALDSSAEVGLAVVTTTATVVAVFIPVALMGGIPGQFFKPFGVTVAVSTMFSTLVARLVTPLLASRLLKSVEDSPINTPRNTARNTSRNSAHLQASPSKDNLSAYAKLLAMALRHRLVTLCLAIAVFVSSLTLIPHLPTGLYGSGNTDLANLSLTLPPGTTFARTQALTGTLSDRILTHPDVESIYLDQQVAAANAVIRLKPKGERQLSRQAFEQQVRKQLKTLPDIEFSFDSQGASGSDKALNIVLKSANVERLNATANQLAQQMRQLPGLVEVSTSTGLVKPELLIIPNPQQVKDLGVQLSDIAAMATLATLGDRDANLAEIDAGDRQIPIRVRLAQAHRTNLKSLAGLKVPGKSKEGQPQLVPLSSVADVVVGGGPAEINRFDRERQITVGANLQGVPLGQALDAVYDLPTLKNLPLEITEQTTGDAYILQDVFNRFSLALATAIVMIYAVLVLLYNSFIYPLAVMSALPLSIGGTFVALLLAQKPLDLYALIGIVLLMGLVTKNSILLVDYALLARDRGGSLKQAVIEAGTTRLRPILMTSISTVAGMVPIALELGAGGEVRSPMAIAVIGGFSTATLLTLVVVPVCFTYIANLQQGLSGLGHWVSQVFNRSSPHRPPLADRFISSDKDGDRIQAHTIFATVNANFASSLAAKVAMTEFGAHASTSSTRLPVMTSTHQPPKPA